MSNVQSSRMPGDSTPTAQALPAGESRRRTSPSVLAKLNPITAIVAGLRTGRAGALATGLMLLAAAILAPMVRAGSASAADAEDQKLAEARARVRAALAAMGSGDPQPYMDLWADRDDVTLCGAWGPIEQGHQHLTDTLRWVGSRFGKGQLVPEDVVFVTSGDLAYTVGFERGEVAVDDGPVRPMTIRVTHIYRRFGDEWQLVHRHADFPPPDQRQPTP